MNLSFLQLLRLRLWRSSTIFLRKVRYSLNCRSIHTCLFIWCVLNVFNLSRFLKALSIEIKICLFWRFFIFSNRGRLRPHVIKIVDYISLSSLCYWRAIIRRYWIFQKIQSFSTLFVPLLGFDYYSFAFSHIFRDIHTAEAGLIEAATTWARTLLRMLLIHTPDVTS